MRLRPTNVAHRTAPVAPLLPQNLQVQFLGAVTKQQPFMIVTEYMTGGSLLDMFKRLNAAAQSKQPGPRAFTIWRSVQLALDCARGLAYLHNRAPQAVIHRDLKPANLMLGGHKTFNGFHRRLLQVRGWWLWGRGWPAHPHPTAAVAVACSAPQRHEGALPPGRGSSLKW